MKCQHWIPPPGNGLKHFQKPGDQRLDSCEEETSSASENNVSLSFVLSSAPELETTHWLSVHNVTSLFMHCQNTKS